MPTLREGLDEWWPRAHTRAAAITMRMTFEQVGVVANVGDGVATVLGLPDTKLSELLLFEGGVLGMAISLERDCIGCILLGDKPIAAGSKVRGTGEVARVPVGPGLLGRVLDPVGRPLDGGGAIVAEHRDVVERPAPGLIERARVTRPLATGVLVIDAMLPLGCGQRELIVGDRNTGKTAIAVDAVVNQRDSNVVCVYAMIGQKASTVKAVMDAVRRHGAPERCVFVVAEADSVPGLQWMVPYSACTIAEYFRDRGRDALLVLDDLTKHAAVYRQLSLLLRAPPGREAFPGDIFYIHSRLLERAAQLDDRLGGGSLTALPICETQGGNLTAYIPTNLVSITDGQIVCEPKLFYAGQKPAVNVGLSVSRVGGKSQTSAMKKLAKSLRLDYMQFLELEVFTRFGGMLDEHARSVIERGQRIRAILTQPQYQPLSLGLEIALLVAVQDGLLDGLGAGQIEAYKADIVASLVRHAGPALARITATGELEPGDRTAIVEVIERCLHDVKHDSKHDIKHDSKHDSKHDIKHDIDREEGVASSDRHS